MSAKESVLEMLRQLPDDVTASDLLAAVADRLGPQVEDEEALLDELDRRTAEHLSGKEPGVLAEEFFAQLRAERQR